MYWAHGCRDESSWHNDFENRNDFHIVKPLVDYIATLVEQYKSKYLQGIDIAQQMLDNNVHLDTILKSYSKGQLLGLQYKGGFIFGINDSLKLIEIVSENSITTARWGCNSQDFITDSINNPFVDYGYSTIYLNNLLITQCQYSNSAMHILKNITYQGYKDWNLPSPQDIPGIVAIHPNMTRIWTIADHDSTNAYSVVLFFKWEVDYNPKIYDRFILGVRYENY